MQIPFVQFLALTSSEHMASHGVFIIVQFYQLTQFGKKYIGQESLDKLLRYSHPHPDMPSSDCRSLSGLVSYCCSCSVRPSGRAVQ